MRFTPLVYPSGAAGAALVVLRVSLSLYLLTGATALTGLPAFAICLLAALALSLTFGVFSRIAATATAFTILWMFVALHAPLRILAHVLDASALAVLGPGALSVDAVRFGRRTWRLPGVRRTSV